MSDEKTRKYFKKCEEKRNAEPREKTVEVEIDLDSEVLEKLQALATEYEVSVEAIAEGLLESAFLSGFFEKSHQYTKPIKSVDKWKWCELFTLDEWISLVDSGGFVSSDGDGYWAKDGMESEADVFSTKPLDATHVVWYNK